MTVALRLSAAATSCLMALAAGELGFRAYDAHVLHEHGVEPASPLYELTDAPYRYELRPRVRRYRGRIDINAAGLRGPELEDGAAAGEFRVLFVGDSVTFAGELPYEAGFPSRVEEALRHSAEPRLAHARSLNGGVPGYGPYNERYWLHEKGPALHPDAVVIQFCLNDVVDPLPQWDLTMGDDLPPELVPFDAIPNPAAHRRLLWLRSLRRFHVVDHLQSVWARAPTVQGWPAYLTAEQRLSIEVYSDRHSPEVRWLRRTYLELVDEARRLTPRVLIVAAPLAYQLTPGYPIHSPQDLMRDIARDNDVPFVDLTAALAPLGPSRGFRPGTADGPDVWHFSADGHAAAARAIADALVALVSEQP